MTKSQESRLPKLTRDQSNTYNTLDRIRESAAAGIRDVLDRVRRDCGSAALNLAETLALRLATDTRASYEDHLWDILKHPEDYDEELALLLKELPTPPIASPADPLTKSHALAEQILALVRPLRNNPDVYDILSEHLYDNVHVALGDPITLIQALVDAIVQADAAVRVFGAENAQP